VANQRRAPAGVDVAIPHLARVYDAILGGKDNFAADREAARNLLKVAPDSRALAHAQRAFLVRVVRMLAQSGIRQFIDLGTGIPTSPNVHEVARAVDPTARVIYVDFDPLVVVHSRALLETGAGVVAIEGDIREPDETLADPALRAVIDFAEPVGVLMIGVLHSISDRDDPTGIVARFREEMAPGSYIAIAQFADDGQPEAMAQLQANYADTPWPMVCRGRDQILRFFDGFELLPPGLVDVEQWRPDVAAPPTALRIPGGVGRKAASPRSLS
jgi:hypothetical protein